MGIINFPASCPILFWLLAAAWSGFQALVGYQYGLYIFDSNREKNWHMRRVRFWFYGVPHGAFYFVCTLSGFVAWKFGSPLANKVSEQIGNGSSVATGTGAILVALALLSIAGVSGILPRILYLGNRPV
jgi:hypothetical protein